MRHPFAEEQEQQQVTMEDLDTSLPTAISVTPLEANNSFSCPYCQAYYSHIGYLKKHVREKHANLPDCLPPEAAQKAKNHVCPFCHWSYIHVGHLERHIREKHPDVPRSNDSSPKRAELFEISAQPEFVFEDNSEEIEYNMTSVKTENETSGESTCKTTAESENDITGNMTIVRADDDTSDNATILMEENDNSDN